MGTFGLTGFTEGVGMILAFRWSRSGGQDLLGIQLKPDSSTSINARCRCRKSVVNKKQILKLMHLRQAGGGWRVRGCSLFFPVAFYLLLSCSVGSSSPPADSDLSHLKRAVVTNYAAVVFAHYQDCLSAVEQMKASVDVFLAAPSEQSLRAARQAWLAARTPYSQTAMAKP